MSKDVTDQVIYLDELVDDVFFQITTFQPSPLLLSGSEPLERGKNRQLFVYPTANVSVHGSDMVRGVIVTGVNSAGDHINSFVPRVLRSDEQFRVVTGTGVQHLGRIVQIIEGSMQVAP